VKSRALASIHALGTDFTPPHGASARALAALRAALESAVASGARFALVFATVVATIGALISLLIPRSEPAPPDSAFRTVENFEAFEPVDADPALVDGTGTSR
jgi:hypothetical protein